WRDCAMLSKQVHDQQDIFRLAMRDPARVRRALDQPDCSASLLTFVTKSWHVLEPAIPFTYGTVAEVICEHLEAVTRGEITRLLINVPPGFTKSMLVNVFWPLWEWGPKGMPSMRYISASYDKALSTRDLVKARDLCTSEWYQDRWPIK